MDDAAFERVWTQACDDMRSRGVDPDQTVQEAATNMASWFALPPDQRATHMDDDVEDDEIQI